MTDPKLRLDQDLIQYSVGGHRVSAPHALAALAGGAPLLVLMHGLGSNENDLIQLAPLLPAEFVCASPRAPMRATDPSIDGWSWFPLSLQPGGVTPEQASESAFAAAQSVLEWIDELENKVGVIKQLAVMGFSQGGVMVTSLLRLQPQKFIAGVNCSGFVAPGQLPGDSELQAVRPPLFWGRDDADPIISRAAVELTSSWAPAHTTLTERLYPGAEHSITRTEVADIAEFLRGHLQ